MSCLALTFIVVHLVWFDSCLCLHAKGIKWPFDRWPIVWVIFCPGAHARSRHSARKRTTAVGIQPVGIWPGQHSAWRCGRHSARSAFRPPPISL